MAEEHKVVNSGTTKEGSKFLIVKDLPKVMSQQKTFDQLLQKFKSFSLGKKDNDLNLSMNDKVSANTYEYIDKLKKNTGDDITRFLNKTLQSAPVNSTLMGINSAEDLFNSDSNNFSAFFFERYKNINNKYEDLRIITEYLYELQEAVMTMRDNITNADDLITTVSREISFGATKDSSSTNDDVSNKIIDDVIALEKKYKLLEKISNIIIPGVLTYGNFFAYTIPYRDVFSQYEYRQRREAMTGGIKTVTAMTRENATLSPIHPVIEGLNVPLTPKATRIITPGDDPSIQSRKIIPIVESLTEKYNSVYSSKISSSEIENDLRGIIEGIDIYNDGVPLLEDGAISSLVDEKVRQQALADYRKAATKSTKSPFVSRDTNTDGVVDMSEPSKEDIIKYKDIPDVFIKLYPPERVIPVYVMNYCVGYYVLYEAYGEIRNSILLNSSLNRTNLAFASTKRRELEDDVINVVAQAICNSIDKKYIAENPKFKELIVNAISYEEFYKKKFKVQFIPVNYMTHFKINEDPDTNMGVSVLNKSLFYGKLYLSLLLFKIITILTKSNDMRVYYIRNAGINKNMVNRIQEIARGIKDKQISFNDLASIQTIFSKVGNYKEAFIPMGKSGEKNIEFDILSGQDVQLNTDLMELLRKGMINNTGVPSVMASYMDEADFSRTLVMQHSKYLARIVSLQGEIEKCVTELYKKLIKFDDLTEDDSTIDQFTFNFTRPKALNTQGMTDLISNAESLADFITRMMVPEDDSELTAAFKQELIKSNLLSGVFNWSEYEQLRKNVKIDLKAKKKEKELEGSENG